MKNFPVKGKYFNNETVFFHELSISEPLNEASPPSLESFHVFTDSGVFYYYQFLSESKTWVRTSLKYDSHSSTPYSLGFWMSLEFDDHHPKFVTYEKTPPGDQAQILAQLIEQREQFLKIQKKEEALTQKQLSTIMPVPAKPEYQGPLVLKAQQAYVRMYVEAGFTLPNTKTAEYLEQVASALSGKLVDEDYLIIKHLMDPIKINALKFPESEEQWPTIAAVQDYMHWLLTDERLSKSEEYFEDSPVVGHLDVFSVVRSYELNERETNLLLSHLDFLLELSDPQGRIFFPYFALEDLKFFESQFNDPRNRIYQLLKSSYIEFGEATEQEFTQILDGMIRACKERIEEVELLLSSAASDFSDSVYLRTLPHETRVQWARSKEKLTLQELSDLISCAPKELLKDTWAEFHIQTRVDNLKSFILFITQAKFENLKIIVDDPQGHDWIKKTLLQFKASEGVKSLLSSVFPTLNPLRAYLLYEDDSFLRIFLSLCENIEELDFAIEALNRYGGFERARLLRKESFQSWWEAYAQHNPAHDWLGSYCRFFRMKVRSDLKFKQILQVDLIRKEVIEKNQAHLMLKCMPEPLNILVGEDSNFFDALVMSIGSYSHLFYFYSSIPALFERLMKNELMQIKMRSFPLSAFIIYNFLAMEQMHGRAGIKTLMGWDQAPAHLLALAEQNVDDFVSNYVLSEQEPSATLMWKYVVDAYLKEAPGVVFSSGKDLPGVVGLISFLSYLPISEWDKFLELPGLELTFDATETSLLNTRDVRVPALCVFFILFASIPPEKLVAFLTHPKLQGFAPLLMKHCFLVYSYLPGERVKDVLDAPILQAALEALRKRVKVLDNEVELKLFEVMLEDNDPANSRYNFCASKYSEAVLPELIGSSQSFYFYLEQISPEKRITFLLMNKVVTEFYVKYVTYEECSNIFASLNNCTGSVQEEAQLLALTEQARERYKSSFRQTDLFNRFFSTPPVPEDPPFLIQLRNRVNARAPQNRWECQIL